MIALNWVVVCDGEQRWFGTRSAARKDARATNRHPGNRDVRRFGPYANCDGVARVYSRAEYDAMQRQAELGAEDGVR